MNKLHNWSNGNLKVPQITLEKLDPEIDNDYDDKIEEPVLNATKTDPSHYHQYQISNRLDPVRLAVRTLDQLRAKYGVINSLPF